ncbi:hypothetical protein [Lysinibacillus parviboronicapiens]|uniref:Uncharacterized protein n=1 Tax=Lysinibacillus parviboronicapiens TaxID=436516 RepID=A0ABV2PN17_9BACI|nr:hypothetical protein [Lysinibacillus parviboronicapiens]
MLRFIDDLAGAIYDVFKIIIKLLCYFFAGVLIVGIPLWLIAKFFELLYH